MCLSVGDEASPGNYGMLDQVEALRWIKKNINGLYIINILNRPPILINILTDPLSCGKYLKLLVEIAPLQQDMGQDTTQGYPLHFIYRASIYRPFFRT